MISGYSLSCATLRVAGITTRSVVQLILPSQVLRLDDRPLHHQLQLVDRKSRMILEELIEIHTVELAKYNGDQSGVL